MFSAHISLRRLATVLALCCAGLLLLAGCGLPFGQNAGAQNTLGSNPTPQQLITSLQKSFRSVNAFHVVMQVQNPGPTTQGQIQIRDANGDVIMPDKVKAQATIVLSGQAVQVNLISVGSSQFITDPITGQWRVIKGVLDPRTLTNPDTGLISLISKVQNISQPTADSVNGTACWRVKGQLDAKSLAFLTGGGVPAGTMLQTSACVGKADSLPYQVNLVGQAAPGDTAQTTRTFTMSNYNENITIAAPQV